MDKLESFRMQNSQSLVGQAFHSAWMGGFQGSVRLSRWCLFIFNESLWGERVSGLSDNMFFSSVI